MMPPQLIEIARWVVAGLFTFVLAIAAGSDFKHHRIPNWTVLAVILLFVGWAFAEPSTSWTSAFEAAGIALLLTVVLYLFKFIGAGDSKLFTSIALFVGMGYLPLFAFATAVVGGAMAVVSLAVEPRRALVMFQMRGKGDFGRKIPYGVAIAVAGLYTFFLTMSEH
jgi:prepilin peptidase CpaA